MLRVNFSVNAYEANVPNRVGSNLFAYKLLVELEKHTRFVSLESDLIQKEPSHQVYWTIYLPSDPLADLPKEREGWRYKVVTPTFMWTQWRLPLSLLFAPRQHVFLSLGHYAPRFCRFPSVVCVLDLAFLKLPQFFRKQDLYKLREWTKYSVKKAAHVFTISEHSKKDVMEIYKKNSEDVTIVFPGAEGEGIEKIPTDTQFAENETKILGQYGLLSKHYIVSVGTIQPRKNMINALKAFEMMYEKDPTAIASKNLKLVFVGKSGWMTQEFDLAVQQSTVRDRIVITGFVDDSVKYTLLRNAGCSILIGYYEGFGIPAVESLRVGVTPVVANTASLPEVVGEFGILVDPYSVEDIARGIREAFENEPGPMRRSQMHEWASQFSWQVSAKKMVDLLIEKYGK